MRVAEQQGQKLGNQHGIYHPFTQAITPLSQITTLKQHDDKGTAQKYQASLGESPGPCQGVYRLLRIEDGSHERLDVDGGVRHDERVPHKVLRGVGVQVDI